MATIKTAVIGVGHLGKNHARHLSKITGSQLIGVSDTNRQAAEEIARLYNVKSYTDYKKLLKTADAVSIATPTVAHYQIARQALSQGIHTFIEKPITATVAQAGKLIELSKKHKTVLQVGHIERFNPAFAAARPFIDGPKFIECHRLSPFSFRSTDIDIVLDLMIHDIDLILSIVKSPVKKIDAVGVRIISGKNDLANARLVFENGCVANLTASRASDKAMRKMRIFTGDAYASIDFAEKTASVYQSKGDLSTLATNPPPGFNPKEFMLEKFIDARHLPVTPADQLEQELTAFIQTINGRPRSDSCSGPDARNALDVCRKILKKL